MVKIVDQSKAKKTNPIQKILITQPKPSSDKSPYFELSKNFEVELEFMPLIKLEGIMAKDFRKQKVDVTKYSSVIFTSRNAIDHFFRTCEELKISVSPDTKYFCITEAVALYLQKFILYRKRKVFYGSDGSNRSLFEAMYKHKDSESFLYVCSENQQDNDIVSYLKENSCEYAMGYMYRTLSSDVKDFLTENTFDIICFFTPSGINSLFHNLPDFKQNGTYIGTFGDNTIKAAQKAGLKAEIVAPLPKAPSMVSALQNFLTGYNKK